MAFGLTGFSGQQLLSDRLMNKLGYVIVKGGSTGFFLMSDVLTAKRAKFLGCLKPGVGVFHCDKDSKRLELPVLLFHGNAGQQETLFELLRCIRDKRQ